MDTKEENNGVRQRKNHVSFATAATAMNSDILYSTFPVTLGGDETVKPRKTESAISDEKFTIFNVTYENLANISASSIVTMSRIITNAIAAKDMSPAVKTTPKRHKSHLARTLTTVGTREIFASLGQEFESIQPSSASSATRISQLSKNTIVTPSKQHVIMTTEDYVLST